MEFLIAALKTTFAFFIVMALWFLWMTYVRHKSGARSDQDVLEHMTKCAGCRNNEKCRSRKALEKQNELTRI